MRNLTIISLATALTFAQVATAQPRSPRASIAEEQSAAAERRFEDWRATCDNAGTCHAWAARSDDAGGWIRIAMAAGPDARPGIAAGSSSANGTTRTGLRIDAHEITMTPSTVPDSAWVGTLEDETARSAIAAMAETNSVQVTGGTTPPVVSLAGFAQALGWIDDRQGRAGTVTALIDRGAQPAATVTLPLPLPALLAAAAVDQTGFGDGAAVPSSVEAMPDLIACREDWGETYRPRTSISARLGARTELWGAQCSMTTYNAGYLLYLTGPDGRDPQRLVLPGALDTTGDFVNPVYDPQSRTLTQSAWDNKWGHCGRIQTWVWTGSAFALQTEQAVADCIGIPPPFWPTLWRSR